MTAHNARRKSNNSLEPSLDTAALAIIYRRYVNEDGTRRDSLPHISEIVTDVLDLWREVDLLRFALTGADQLFVGSR